ncbi:hypothetical protein MNBD_GAMMA09-1860 [hydrothermal vent metagenome]|uniref:PEP-CTERM protein-sorting domain-containing protein n=1 Tax=hydrothermal vent metagenome TaxID=652676 RepID=A0A3B0XJX4_9ZZZZ
MKKIMLACPLAAVLTVGMSVPASAALSSNALLNFLPGVVTSTSSGAQLVNSGSYFGFDFNGDGRVAAAERTAISQNEGLKISQAQRLPGGGTGIENAVIDLWRSFGDTGTHWTSLPANILTDDGAGEVTIDLTGWTANLNGNQNISLGSGAWGGFVDGVAQINCALDCSDGDTYTLDYTATVPPLDPSGKGGLAYLYHLEGRISSVPLPAAVWLFGSGLLGLVGVARWRKT